MYYNDGKIDYEGDFVKSKFEGNGKRYYYNLGTYYIGEFKNGLKHGKGTIFFMDGKVHFKGNFFEDFKEGNGKLYNQDGSYYIGTWVHGKKDGKGKEYDKNGNFLCGKNFDNGKSIDEPKDKSN